jgi:mRNA-degrading endonuclease RelE of RelBE toxin-antitoxin system
MPYEVMLLPRARRALDRLAPLERNAVLAALRHDLDANEVIVERVEADRRTYLRAPLGVRYHVLYRPLSGDEVRRLVDRGVLTEPANRAYAVLSLDSADKEAVG